MERSDGKRDKEEKEDDVQHRAKLSRQDDGTPTAATPSKKGKLLQRLSSLSTMAPSPHRGGDIESLASGDVNSPMALTATPTSTGLLTPRFGVETPVSRKGSTTVLDVGEEEEEEVLCLDEEVPEAIDDTYTSEEDECDPRRGPPRSSIPSAGRTPTSPSPSHQLTLTSLFPKQLQSKTSVCMSSSPSPPAVQLTSLPKTLSGPASSWPYALRPAHRQPLREGEQKGIEVQGLSSPSLASWECTENEQVLRQFDMEGKYGPCAGVPRLRRWELSKTLGLNPPPLVYQILTASPRAQKEKHTSVLDQRLVEV
eukprot:GHVN01086632.1.p1 GENE.GHVN01086632.1~~GHVN01086632.1.p1  ORF type:complete len:311 (-),score=54.66 GHVN01086632.1:216-1148(-)